MTLRNLSSRIVVYGGVCLFGLVVLIHLTTDNYTKSVVEADLHGRDYFLQREASSVARGDGSNAPIATHPDDEHIHMADGLVTDRPRAKYPTRVNMGACPARFGKVLVLVVVVEKSYKT